VTWLGVAGHAVRTTAVGFVLQVFCDQKVQLGGIHGVVEILVGDFNIHYLKCVRPDEVADSVGCGFTPP
jgi:hypothetical protein